MNYLTPLDISAGMLNMTRGEYLAWSVNVTDALNLSDVDFKLWYSEVIYSYKLGTADEWSEVRARWVKLNEGTNS